MAEALRVIDPITQVELVVPVYASPERAIRRAALTRDGYLRVIHFYPDWPHLWPLWDDTVGQANPEDLGLTEALKLAMRRWYDYWHVTYQIDKGWPTASTREMWVCEGDALVERLQQEVWDFAEVVADHRFYAALIA